MNGREGRIHSGGGPVADEDRSIDWVCRGRAMASSDQVRIERNHVEQSAKAELLLH